MSSDVDTTISSLPIELITIIISYINPLDVINLSRTSTKFNKICNEEHIWRSLYRMIYGNPRKDTISNWRKAFAKRDCFAKFWRKDKVNLRFFSGHKGSITCIDYDDRFLLTGSVDRTLKIWSLDSGKCTHSYNVNNVVDCLQFDRRKIVTGTNPENAVKLWSLTNGKVIPLYRHCDRITCLQYLDHLLASGSTDSNLIFYDLQQDKKLLSINLHKRIYAMKFATVHGEDHSKSVDSIIVGGSGGIDFIDQRRGPKSFLHLDTQGQSIKSIETKRNIVISGTDSGSVIGWDTRKMSEPSFNFKLFRYPSHVSMSYSFEQDRLVLGGGYESTFWVYDGIQLFNPRLLFQSGNVHYSPASQIKADFKRVVIGSLDYSASVCQFSK